MYFHVPIWSNFQKCLRFVVTQLHFQFLCLPCSLKPHRFSQKEIRVNHYLDEIVLLLRDREVLFNHRDLVISTVQEFGWVKLKKNPT